MDSFFKTYCNFSCWECPQRCGMKEAMENLSKEQFEAYVLSNAKIQAGINIASGRMNAQTSQQHVKTVLMSLVCARQKYLETLKN